MHFATLTGEYVRTYAERVPTTRAVNVQPFETLDTERLGSMHCIGLRPGTMVMVVEIVPFAGLFPFHTWKARNATQASCETPFEEWVFVQAAGVLFAQGSATQATAAA